jgi:hypothetical protein
MVQDSRFACGEDREIVPDREKRFRGMVQEQEGGAVSGVSEILIFPMKKSGLGAAIHWKRNRLKYERAADT